MNNKTQVWKQASEVYAEISELSAKQALAHVYGINNITADVKEAIITLINAGSQASQYFQDNITPHFDFGFNSENQFKIGQQLDEYELIGKLGQGGMSQVFQAKRINSDQQTHVAIKIFAPRNNSQELLNHFTNEQRILVDLQHKNIVKMLHGGKTDSDITYLVMELISGALPINKYCIDNKISLRNKIKYIAQCADALSYSHANLIIHRDLKPENILIGDNNELKIVDFGIAKLINNDIYGDKTTIMALTPNFAAPEQINSEKITVKTDIFSLAAVALDLLIKGSPLPKDRLLKSCANDEYHIDMTFKNIIIDKDLKNILQKAISHLPDIRYSSMQNFCDDLNNWLDNKPVNATSQSLYYRIKKFAQRRSALFATMLSFVVFLSIASIVSYVQYRQIKLEAAKAQVVKQFMLDSFKSTNPNSHKGIEISAKDLLEASAQKLSNDTQLDTQIRFELLQTLGLAYGAIGAAEQAVDLLKQSLLIKPEDSQSLSNLAMYLFDIVDAQTHDEFLDSIDIEKLDSNTDKVRVLRVQAKIFARNSDFGNAMKVLNKALDLNRLDKDKTEELFSMRLLAEFYYLQSQPQKGIELLKLSLAQVNNDTPLTLILGMKSDLGTLYNDIGEYNLALTELLQSITQIRNILGNENLELSKVLSQIAGTYRKLGKMDKAQIAANESYQINLEVFGENNINTATSLNMLAVMKYQTGEIAVAITYMQKAIKIFEQQKTDSYTDTLELKTNLAALLSLSDRNEEAKLLLIDIYSKQLEQLGPKHDSTIYTQQILARTLAKLNHLPEALRLASAAAENAKQYLGLKNPLTAGAMFTLASIYQQDLQKQAALDLFIEIEKDQLIQQSNPKYPILLKYIAELYMDLNEKDKAAEYYLSSIEQHIKIYQQQNLKTLNVQLGYAALLRDLKQHEKSNIILEIVKQTILDEGIKDLALLQKLRDLK